MSKRKKLSKDEIKNKRLYNTYGITLKEWKNLLVKQQGVCAICKTLPPSKILCVDHIHVPGFKKMVLKEKKKYVRGLLCFRCNTSFGKIERQKEPRKLLEGINKYFEEYKMKGDNIDS